MREQQKRVSAPMQAGDNGWRFRGSCADDSGTRQSTYRTPYQTIIAAATTTAWPRLAAPLRMLMMHATPPWTVSTMLTATWRSMCGGRRRTCSLVSHWWFSQRSGSKSLLMLFVFYLGCMLAAIFSCLGLGWLLAFVVIRAASILSGVRVGSHFWLFGSG
jgi:hypothetical protein